MGLRTPCDSETNLFVCLCLHLLLQDHKCGNDVSTMSLDDEWDLALQIGSANCILLNAKGGHTDLTLSNHIPASPSEGPSNNRRSAATWVLTLGLEKCLIETCTAVISCTTAPFSSL